MLYSRADTERSRPLDWSELAVDAEAAQLPAGWRTWRSHAWRDPSGDHWTVYERVETSAYILRVPDDCRAASRALCCVHDLSGAAAAADSSRAHAPPHFCEQRGDAARDSSTKRPGASAVGGASPEVAGDGAGARRCDPGTGPKETLAATSLRLVDAAVVNEGAIRRQTLQDRHIECAVRMPAHWAYIVRVDAFEVFDCHFMDRDAFVEIWAGAHLSIYSYFNLKSSETTAALLSLSLSLCLHL